MTGTLECTVLYSPLLDRCISEVGVAGLLNYTYLGDRYSTDIRYLDKPCQGAPGKGGRAGAGCMYLVSWLTGNFSSQQKGTRVSGDARLCMCRVFPAVGCVLNILYIKTA